MKRKLGWILTVAMCLAAPLSACAGSRNIVFDADPDLEDARTDLTFFGFKYEALNVTAIETALRGYMAAHRDVNITYDGIKSPEYFDVLRRRIATGNADDLFMIDHDTHLELSGKQKLLDLSGLSTLDQFSPMALSQMRVDGSIDYVPTTISAFGLYCNLDLLRFHGQSVPENYEEFAAVCDYFAGAGITPIVANNDISLKTLVIARGMYDVYQSADVAAELSRFNRGEADLAATLAPGFRLAGELITRGWVDAEEALATDKTRDDLRIFAEGERPFMLTGAWAAARVRDMAPGLDFTVTPYPVLADGSVLVVNIDTRIAVNAESPRAAAAVKFLEYFTQEDVLMRFVNSQSSFSPLRANPLADAAAVRPITPYLSNGRSVLGADDHLTFPIWDLIKESVRDMLRGLSADEALAEFGGSLTVWQED